VRFLESKVAGAFVVDLETFADDRGFFARVWCARELGERGLESRLAQCSTSFNRRKGTLRGMHYQIAPHAEAKLVRCIRGAIHDVVVDLRRESPTFRRWDAVELTAENRRGLYIPPGCAHGFQTVADDSEVLYFISEFHAPDAARGARWNDPAFAIEWPLPDPILSERDRTYPDFQ
jgi:dTDP-4-dehydrorhamnose 3,5-epimerase